MTDEQKNWIDYASNYQLLYRWRFGDGDEIFQGESGAYYSEAMKMRRADMKPGEWTKLSKIIGWG